MEESAGERRRDGFFRKLPSPAQRRAKAAAPKLEERNNPHEYSMNNRSQSSAIADGFLRNAPDFAMLKELTQIDLAEICCERWVYDIIRSGGFPNKGVNPFETLSSQTKEASGQESPK
jgi:hypothetical protein